MKHLITFAAAATILVSCSSNNKVVAYFSATGRTRAYATQVAQMANAELFEITPEIPYTEFDLNWCDTYSRSSMEMNDANARPAIAKKLKHLKRIDTLYVGFPIWWFTAPRIIDTFLEENDLSGKTVYFFATSGGTGIGRAVKELRAKHPEINYGGCKLFHFGTEEEIKELILTDQQKRMLCGGYSEYREIFDEDLELFKATVHQEGMEFIPERVATQVVAGMNYQFHCRYNNLVKGSAGICRITIYKDLQGKAEVTSIEMDYLN